MKESAPEVIAKENKSNAQNEGILNSNNINSYKFRCEDCGKKFKFNISLKKHKRQFPGKHIYYKCCHKVELTCNHKCKREPLKNNAVKKNQINEESVEINGIQSDCKSVNDEMVSNSVKGEDTACEDAFSIKKKSKKNIYENETFEHKIFKCQECLQSFNKYSDLSHHLKLIHYKQGKFKCSICDENFNSKEEERVHLALHGPEDKVICKGCKKTFLSLKSYYIHAKKNPGMHCFMCKLCLRKFSTELMLEQHVCICQNGEPLQCACGALFTKYEDVISHSKGTKPFTCCSCPHLAHSLTAYLRHLRKHSKQKPFQCMKCNIKFAVIDFLNIHNKKFHSESENIAPTEPPTVKVEEEYNCSLCNEKFDSGDDLKEHNNKLHLNKTSDEIERVQCPDCGKLLKKNRLENHRNSHKTSASLCPECGKLFDTRFKLTQHMITTHNNEPVKCEVCSKMLKTKKILNEHMKTHLKSEHGGRIPQAICPMCGLGLAQKGSLARHILLTHEKHKIVPCNKTYTCQECSEVLPNRSKYYSHRRMHRAMVDRFPCDICGREFNKKQNLKRHKYLLHDESRVIIDPIFKCQFCTRSFREKKNLKRHYKMVHKVEDIV